MNIEILQKLLNESVEEALTETEENIEEGNFKDKLKRGVAMAALAGGIGAGAEAASQLPNAGDNIVHGMQQAQTARRHRR